MKMFPVIVLLLSLAGCVGGKLDPRVAQTVAILDVAACAVADVFVADKRVGTVCAGAVPLVNGLLSSMSAPTLPLLRAPAKAVARTPIRYQGATIGHLDPEIASAVQAKLDAMGSQ